MQNLWFSWNIPPISNTNTSNLTSPILLYKTIILHTTTNISDKGIPYQSTHTKKQEKSNLITKSIIQELNNGTRNPKCKKLKLTYTMAH